MNKIITIVFVLLIGYCEAATGNASDGPLFVIVIIGLVLLIAGIGYFIDLMKIKLKEYRSRRLIKRNNFDQNDEFLNVFNNPNPPLPLELSHRR